MTTTTEDKRSAAARRKREHDQRKKDAGLIQVNVWCRPGNAALIREIAAATEDVDLQLEN